jgi:hypothetical protein|nr:MAG TPA: hypothetical protein [Caudoviricetes sp.]
MNKENLLKDLEEAITKRKELIVDLGDNIKINLNWDNEISNYRGYVPELDMEFGIWTIEGLVKMLTEDSEVTLSVA